ncbi:hypothetical protein [Desulfovibrio litoralis]|nr:hypothetical protein [Desulfovibrio litoralis]
MTFWVSYIDNNAFLSNLLERSYLALGILGPSIGIIPALYGRDKFSNGRILSLIGLIFNLILMILSVLLIFVATMFECPVQ